MTPTTNATIAGSCEDSSKTYITFPDGLRLIFEDGQYTGWYVCGEVTP